ncbi:LuxR C-terminal-related transcriptional regulator [Amycolatopsis sp. NPDC051903]|uniref:helix-turn-helix transcriptional regulator n=1 Tax=Amycolatopsis sp. NPDC051903 TaxID=3363936 RepID=UPI0037B7A03D
MIPARLDRLAAGLITPGRPGGSALLVTAGPGTGKTRLVQETVRRARAAGYATVHASASDGSAAQLAAPFVGQVGTTSLGAIAEWLDRTARARPVLYAVDDVDRIDAPWVTALLSMTEAFRSRPVVFLLTASGAVGGPRHRGLGHATLPPLPPPAAAELLRGLPVPVTGRRAIEIMWRAKGNPRALVELGRAGTEGSGLVSPRIRSIYGERLASMPEETARALLYAAGRVGAEPLSTVECALRDPTARQDLWTPAVSASLVELGDDVTFPDPLVAEAVYHSAPAAVRRQLHADFVAAIAEPSFERAMHQGRVPLGPDADAANALEEASRRALAVGALQQAGLAAHRAAELRSDQSDAARAYLLAGLAAAAAGDGEWARDVAPLVLRRTERPDLRAGVAMTTALALSRKGLQREAMETLEGAARSHPPADRLTALGSAVCASVVAAASGLAEHLAAARRLLRFADTLALRSPPVPVLGSADPDLQRAAAEVRLDAGRALSRQEIVRRPESGARAADRLALAELADRSGAAELAVELRWGVLMDPVAEPSAPHHPEAWPLLAAGLIVSGRWPEADQVLGGAGDLAATHELTLLQVEVFALRAMLLALRGDAPGARSLAEGAWPLLDLGVNREAHRDLLRALGFAALTAGDYDTATRDFLDMDAMCELAGSFFPRLLDPLGLAIAASRSGRTRDALPAVNRIRERAGAHPPAHVSLALDHAYALLCDDGSAEERFLSAIHGPGAPARPVERSLARLHFGAWLRRKRRPSEARLYLTDAITGFDRLGAASFTQAARVELQASGGQAGSAPCAAPLSAQQVLIAGLAAQGLGNPEIAERLQVSPRTVSSHLRNAYLRLGISGRNQLRQALPAEIWRSDAVR